MFLNSLWSIELPHRPPRQDTLLVGGYIKETTRMKDGLLQNAKGVGLCLIMQTLLPINLKSCQRWIYQFVSRDLARARWFLCFHSLRLLNR